MDHKVQYTSKCVKPQNAMQLTNIFEYLKKKTKNKNKKKKIKKTNKK